MIGPYAVLASRIRHEIAELERVVERVGRAAVAVRDPSADQEFALDSAALNLHDFYTGLERVFAQVAAVVDTSQPTGSDWRRELLRQMTLAIPGGRPQVLQIETARKVDELLRFRHVVRHVYAFDLDLEPVARLAGRLRPTWVEVSTSLIAFAAYLDTLATEA